MELTSEECLSNIRSPAETVNYFQIVANGSHKFIYLIQWVTFLLGGARSSSLGIVDTKIVTGKRVPS